MRILKRHLSDPNGQQWDSLAFLRDIDEILAQLAVFGVEIGLVICCHRPGSSDKVTVWFPVVLLLRGEVSA